MSEESKNIVDLSGSGHVSPETKMSSPGDYDGFVTGLMRVFETVGLSTRRENLSGARLDDVYAALVATGNILTFKDLIDWKAVDARMHQYDFGSGYKCAGCGEMFPIRHPGTIIIMAKSLQIRAIGRNNECVLVGRYIRQHSDDYLERLPLKFHDNNCFVKFTQEVEADARRKLKELRPEDLLFSGKVDMEALAPTDEPSPDKPKSQYSVYLLTDFDREKEEGQLKDLVKELMEFTGCEEKEIEVGSLINNERASKLMGKVLFNR